MQDTGPYRCDFSLHVKVSTGHNMITLVWIVTIMYYNSYCQGRRKQIWIGEAMPYRALARGENFGDHTHFLQTTPTLIEIQTVRKFPVFIENKIFSNISSSSWYAFRILQFNRIVRCHSWHWIGKGSITTTPYQTERENSGEAIAPLPTLFLRPCIIINIHICDP